jgi:hypothetical protein
LLDYIYQDTSAKDCGREEIDTSEYEEILEERLTKDCVAVPVVKVKFFNL